MEAEDSAFYYVFLGGLVLGLAAAVVLVAITPRQDDPFSAVSFSYPDDLPNYVRLGNTYDFDYVVQSFENETKNYTLTADLELFRLYDTTEGLYSCLSPYRHKVYLEWNNETNLSHVSINDTNSLIPDLSIKPDNVSIIDWENYYFSFSLGRALGKGEFVIWFGSDKEEKYRFSLLAENNSAFFNGEYIGAANISAQNDKIKITYEDSRLNFSFNGKTLMKRYLEDMRGGQFGFESRDVFISLGSISVSKEIKVDVPDTENRWDYELDSNLFYGLLTQSRQATKRELKMDRRYIVEGSSEFVDVDKQVPASVDEQGNFNTNGSEIYDAKNEEGSGSGGSGRVPVCKSEFACNYLITDDQDYYVQADNISSVLMTLPSSSYGVRYWLQTRNESESIIAWENFSVNATFSALSDQDSITFLFGEDFAIMFTNKSFSVIVLDDGTVSIRQHPISYTDRPLNSSDEQQDIILRNFSVVAEGNRIKIRVGNEEDDLFLSSSLFNKTFKALHWNTYSNIRNIILKSSDSSCSSEEYYNLCEIVYGFNQPRPSQREPDPSLYGSVVQDFSYYDEINLSEFSQEIPSRKLDFSGQLAKLVNRTNTTFHMDYQFLDGDGIVQAGIKDDDGNIILSVTNFLLSNRSVIEFKGENTTLIKKFNLESWHSLDISLFEKNITLFHNRTSFFNLREDVRDGYFFISTIDTHVELDRVYIRNENNKWHTNLPLLDDPCRLRVVFREQLRDESFILEPWHNMTFTDKFRLEDFFDYGKVSVSLNGSSNTNNTDLKIHFWMVRS